MAASKEDPTPASAILKAGRGGLILLEDMPLHWRVNQHIHSGYRFRSTIYGCIASMFSISNESFNIWSHALGLYLVFLRQRDSDKRLAFGISGLGYNAVPAEDSLALSSFSVACVVALFCSVSWHTMCCHSQQWVFDSFDTADLMGVTILVAASALMVDYTAFYCDPFWRWAYCSLTAILALGALISMATPTLRHADTAWLRVAFFVGIGFSSIIPIVHLVCNIGVAQAMSWYWPMVNVWVPVLTGALVYGTKVPESIWPGRFDYIGSSHNIWHVASLVTIINGHSAVEQMYLGALHGTLGACQSGK